MESLQTSTHKSASTEWIPELTGVRGLAVLLVLISHLLFANTQIPGYQYLMQIGNLGVNLFFVLSGFLITKILSENKVSKKYYFTNFYLRRALRILPLYFLVITFFFLFSSHFVELKFINSTAALFSQDEIWFYALLANWLPNFLSSPILYVGHIWSLCVEEQFYLLWPLAVRWLNFRNVFFLTLILILASTIYRWQAVEALSAYELRHRIYISTLTRADSLLSGCLVFFIYKKFKQNSHWSFYLKNHFFYPAWIGVFALYQLTLTENGAYYFISYTFSNLFFMGLLLKILIAKNHYINSFFTFRILNWLGILSYGIYIFHFPIICWLQMDYQMSAKLSHLGSVPSIVIPASIEVAIIFTLSWASWTFIEKPFLSLKSRFQ